MPNIRLAGCEGIIICESSEESAVFTRAFELFHTKQLMAGGGVALIGITLVPLLSGLF